MTITVYGIHLSDPVGAEQCSQPDIIVVDEYEDSLIIIISIETGSHGFSH